MLLGGGASLVLQPSPRDEAGAWQGAGAVGASGCRKGPVPPAGSAVSVLFSTARAAEDLLVTAARGEGAWGLLECCSWGLGCVFGGCPRAPLRGAPSPHGDSGQCTAVSIAASPRGLGSCSCPLTPRGPRARGNEAIPGFIPL